MRDVLSRKGRTALVALSILIGVFGAVSLMSVNDLLVKQIKSDINPDEIAMTRLYVSVPSAEAEVDNEADLQTLRGLPGVTEAEGHVVAPVFWKRPGEENYFNGDIMAFTEPFGEIALEPMRLVEGTWPASGQNEIVIERRMADEFGLAVGDQIVFRPLGETSGEPDAWTITGTVFHPYYVEASGGPSDAEERIYASYDDAQQIAGFTGLSTFYLRYIDTDAAADQAEQLKQTTANQTSYIPMYHWLDDPEDYFLIGEVQQITNVLNILAIVALVVSGFLVTNVINTIVVEQKRQIGVLKSIGATRWDTFVIYAGIALIYGIIGTIPGVILGVLVGSVMAQELDTLAFTLIDGFKVSTTALIIGAVMGLLVPVLASLLPVLNGTRVSILDAMTDLGIASNWGKGWLSRLVNRLPVPITTRQALSNVVQKKGRLLLTGITLTLATAAFMGVFAVFSRLTSEINNLFNTFNFEISVFPAAAQDYEQVRQEFLAVEGVEEVYPGVGFNVQVLDLSGTVLEIGAQGEDEISAVGYDPATDMVNITYSEGQGWQEGVEEPQVVLTSAAAKRANKTVGDQVIVSAGGRSAQYEIIGIASYPFEMMIMRWQDLAQLAGFVTGDSGTPDDISDDTPLPTAYFIRLSNQDISAIQVDAVINDISDRMAVAGISAEYFNQVQDKEDQTEGILVFGMIFQLTSAVMAAVGAIGLLTTLSMAVFERQKEIGVMRSIGARSRTIIAQFEVEGIIIAVLAWLVALPLSYLLGLALMGALGFDDFITFQYPLWVAGLGLVGIVFVAIIASLWPSIAASRKTVSDILRYQ
ncbi:MAG: ABC transporter permease [Chloroflexi bacterium]|nr:ABC transporter permease [Chloroflexota bacterium]